MSNTKRIVVSAVLVSLALAFSYVERFIPLQLLIPLPGIKLGLANIVTLTALYLLRGRLVFAVVALRCLLGAVFGKLPGTFAAHGTQAPDQQWLDAVLRQETVKIVPVQPVRHFLRLPQGDVQQELQLPGQVPVFQKHLVQIDSSVKTPQADGLGWIQSKLSGRRS